MESYRQALLPPWWARGGHAQTLLGHLLPSPGARIGSAWGQQPIRIDLADGDTLIAFRLAPTGKPRRVRVHLFHGLSGDVNSEYMRRTADVLTAAGFEVWAVNHRGCGEGEGLARGTYHSGKTEDMAAVLAASRADAPELRHAVIGFSLSGNIALLLAAQERGPGTDAAPDAIIAVNPPMDLAAAARDIRIGLSRLYELRFLRRLCRTIRARYRDGLLDAPLKVSPWMSLAEFDDIVTAPLGGFESGQDYYERCSTHKRLTSIQVPTVILTTKDDPFVSAKGLDQLARSSSVHLHVEQTGGHVGYLSKGGSNAPWERWLDGALLHYMAQLCPGNSAEVEGPGVIRDLAEVS